MTISGFAEALVLLAQFRYKSDNASIKWENWALGEPNHLIPTNADQCANWWRGCDDEKCVEVEIHPGEQHFKWNNVDCERSNMVICEKFLAGESY